MDRTVDLRDYEQYPDLLLTAAIDAIQEMYQEDYNGPSSLLLTDRQYKDLVGQVQRDGVPEKNGPERTGTLFGVPFEVIGMFPYLIGGVAHGHAVPENFRTQGSYFEVPGPLRSRQKGAYISDTWTVERYVRMLVDLFGEPMFVWAAQDMNEDERHRLIGRELIRAAARAEAPGA